ncbi:MAG: universal stress protein [Haloarculaceae archaeon]
MAFDTVLLPTDGSDSAGAAAARGFDLALQLDAPVHGLSVANSGLATSATYVGDASRIRERLREQATQHVNRLDTAARDRGLDVEPVVREGIPAEEIVTYANEQGIDAIAMGTSGRGGVARMVVGSVTDKVVRTATVPVLSVNRRAVGDGGERFESILLPTDGSDPAEAAATRGVELAERLGATVHCFSVADEGIAGELEALMTGRDRGSVDSLIDEAADNIDRVVATAIDCDVDCVSATATGDPAEEIVAYAEAQNLDLIVMGTHGRGGFRRAVVGSVTDDVIRTATVPVLSVGATGDAAGNDGEHQ